MTRDKATKKAARTRVAETGESYTRARRAVKAQPANQPEDQPADQPEDRPENQPAAPAAGQLAGEPDGAAEDQAQWWRAYVLAEDDRVDELRRHAEAGDDHARRQLAGWLSDRCLIDEAVTVIRPLADAGDDVARLWLARWLAEADEDDAGGAIDELRRRAGSGDVHAQQQLAGWLAGHGGLAELRELLAGHRELLAGSWASTHGPYQLEVLRLRADLGDDHAGQFLASILSRRRARQAWPAPDQG